jgi:hypothetical protein
LVAFLLIDPTLSGWCLGLWLFFEPETNPHHMIGMTVAIYAEQFLTPCNCKTCRSVFSKASLPLGAGSFFLLFAWILLIQFMSDMDQRKFSSTSPILYCACPNCH